MSARAQKPSLPLSLNLNVRGLKPSATLAINERCDEIRQQGRKVYKLGLGQSCFPVVPVVVEAQTYCDNVLEAINVTCEWFNR